MEDTVFYLRSSHGNTGSNVMFHNKNGGYGTNLDKLEVIDFKQAEREIKHSSSSYFNMPLLKSAVDALSISHIDHQDLDTDKQSFYIDDLYIIQITMRWDGNDIAFWEDSDSTFDYGQATVMNYHDAMAVAACNPNCVAWPKKYLDTICRRTFQAKNINVHTMIRKPGLKYLKPRKKKPTTGKTRGNCPTCGKITWDYNPYENAYCSILCKP